MAFVVNLDGTWKNYNPKVQFTSLAIALLEVLGNEGARTTMRFTDEQVALVDRLESDYEVKKAKSNRSQVPGVVFRQRA